MSVKIERLNNLFLAELSNIMDLPAQRYDYANKTAMFSALFQTAGISDSFVFFTDPHLLANGNTTDFIPMFNNYTDIIKGFFDRTSTEAVICGGDWLEWSDTPANALYKLNIMTGRMKELFPEAYYPVFGNHDNNYQGTEVEGTKTLTQAAINNVMFPYQGNAYYSIDMTNAKGYVLDTGTDSNTAMDSYRWAHIDWLANKLIDDDADHSAVYAHILWNTSDAEGVTPMIDNVQELIGAYNSHSTVTLNTVEYDFTNCTGKCHYILGGHIHQNKSDTTNYSVPIIARTTTKAASNTPTFDLVLSDWENGKLYFVGIGASATGSATQFNI